MKLSEIVASIKNASAFKQKYGTNLPDEEIKKIFDRFNRQQSRLAIKDIFKYSSLEALKDAISQESEGEKEKKIKAKEANIIVDNDRMMIVEPLSVDASIKYGANTKWCTAAKFQNRFEQYFSNSSLVYFIDKINNKKYAIAYRKKGRSDGFDEEDNAIQPEKILQIFGVNGKEIFSKVVDKSKIFKQKFLDKINPRITGNTINGDVDIQNMNLEKITDLFDFSLYTINGVFDCSNNNLISLEGAPKKVNRSFYCYINKLKTLEGAPKEVGGNFFCHVNNLTSLVGGPQIVLHDFNCSDNVLTSLEGAPQKIGRDFISMGNKLTSLEGAPREVGRHFIIRTTQ